MKKEEAVQQILSITRVCRGKWVLPLEIRQELSEIVNAASMSNYEESEAKLHAVRKQFGLSDVKISSMMDLLNEFLSLINLCETDIGKPCRYDVNQEITKYPFDGARHDFQCPNCGTEIQFYSPIYTLEA